MHVNGLLSLTMSIPSWGQLQQVTCHSQDLFRDEKGSTKWCCLGTTGNRDSAKLHFRPSVKKTVTSVGRVCAWHIPNPGFNPSTK